MPNHTQCAPGNLADLRGRRMGRRSGRRGWFSLIRSSLKSSCLLLLSLLFLLSRRRLIHNSCSPECLLDDIVRKSRSKRHWQALVFRISCWKKNELMNEDCFLSPCLCVAQFAFLSSAHDIRSATALGRVSIAALPHCAICALYPVGIRWSPTVIQNFASRQIFVAMSWTVPP
jgi:hypothetical protein